MHAEGSFVAAVICRSARALAKGIVARQLELDPYATQTYGTGQADLVSDTEVRLGYLAEALAADRVALFAEQLRWLKVLCCLRGVAANAVRLNLECMADELAQRLPEHVVPRVAAMMQLALAELDQAPTELPTYLTGGLHLELARQFMLAVLETREADAVAMVLRAFDDGVPVSELHQHVLQRVQAEMGRMWQMDETTIAEEHYCTGIVTTLLTLMRSRVKRAEPNGRRVITATVSNETHTVGIHLVTQAFEIEGWSAIALGANTPAHAIAEAVRDFCCDVIALSVNMVLYVRLTAEIIAALRAHALTAEVPILVGGQPFNLVSDLWQVVGADGHARSAWDSPAAAAQLLQGRPGL